MRKKDSSHAKRWMWFGSSRERRRFVPECQIQSYKCEVRDFDRRTLGRPSSLGRRCQIETFKSLIFIPHLDHPTSSCGTCAPSARYESIEVKGKLFHNHNHNGGNSPLFREDARQQAHHIRINVHPLIRQSTSLLDSADADAGIPARQWGMPYDVVCPPMVWLPDG